MIMSKLLKKMVLSLTVIALGLAVSPCMPAFAEEDALASLTEGANYYFSGMGHSAKAKNAIYLGHDGNSAFFQSTGLCKGYWPGSDALNVTQDCWGDFGTYNVVSNVYLPRNDKGEKSSANRPVACTYYNGTKWVQDERVKEGVLESARIGPTVFGGGAGAWLGTLDEKYEGYAFSLEPRGYSGHFSDDWASHVMQSIAPCFTVDLSKVNVNGNTITVKKTEGADVATALSGKRVAFVVGLTALVALAIVICATAINRKRNNIKKSE